MNKLININRKINELMQTNKHYFNSFTMSHDKTSCFGYRTL